MKKSFPHNNFLIEITSHVNREQWNSLVQSVPEGTIFQTTYWADYWKEWANVEPIYLTVRNRANKVVGLQLCFKEPYLAGALSQMPFAQITAVILRKVMPIYKWRAGPLIFGSGNLEEILDRILTQLKTIARTNAILGISPLFFGRLPREEAKRCFRKNGFRVNSRATFLINLTLDEDALWDGLDRSAHRAIRRCQKEGVRVERIKAKDELKNYYKLLLETRKRLGFGLPPCFPNSVMWKHLREREALEIFVVKQDEKWLAAMGVIGFNNTITEIAVAQSNYSLKKKIYTSELIKWEIIKWGHRQGYEFYDLAGVSPNPKTKKEKGIYQFKAKWGGELVNYAVYDRRPLGLKRYFIDILSFVAILIKRIKY